MLVHFKSPVHVNAQGSRRTINSAGKAPSGGGSYAKVSGGWESIRRKGDVIELMRRGMAEPLCVPMSNVACWTGQFDGDNKRKPNGRAKAVDDRGTADARAGVSSDDSHAVPASGV